MADYIDRQAAIELCDWYQHEFCECDYAFGELANELHKLPSAQPEPRWIPCSEKMPKVDEEVLATTVWGDVTIACRIGVDEWFIHEGGTNATTEDLIAWMPLPNPYKENT